MDGEPRSDRFRRKANAARAKAANMKHPSDRASMLAIADEWDELAQRAAARESDNPARDSARGQRRKATDDRIGSGPERVPRGHDAAKHQGP